MTLVKRGQVRVPMKKDPVLRRLTRLAERARQARRDRDDAIRKARLTHGPTAIGRATGLSTSRIIQIVRERKE